MSLIIDLSLLGVYALTLLICYQRGFFKTVITFLKIILSFAATYMVQDVVRPIVDNLVPLDLSTGIDYSISGFATSLFEKYFQVFMGNFITSVIVFIAFYIVFSLLGNLIIGVLDRFTLTRFINKLGGLAIGILLGGVATLAACYIVAIVLLMNNSTTGIMTIYNSYILKYVVADNIQFILTNLIR